MRNCQANWRSEAACSVSINVLPICGLVRFMDLFRNLNKISIMKGLSLLQV